MGLELDLENYEETRSICEWYCNETCEEKHCNGYGFVKAKPTSLVIDRETHRRIKFFILGGRTRCHSYEPAKYASIAQKVRAPVS